MFRSIGKDMANKVREFGIFLISDKVMMPVAATIVLGSLVVGNRHVDQILAKRIAREMELDWEQKWALSKMEDDFGVRAQWLLGELEAEKKKKKKSEGENANQHN